MSITTGTIYDSGGLNGVVTFRLLNTSAAATSTTIGFDPRLVYVIDETNSKNFTWAYGMTAGSSIEITSGGYFATNGVTVSSGVLTLGTCIVAASGQMTVVCFH